MQPLVSIIIPIYNAEKQIENCIESIQKQSYSNIEIICVNDGSKDNTASILDKLAQDDARIKVIHNENQGVSATRNCGIRNATGEYIQFVDSDDRLYPTITEKLVCEMVQNQVDWVLFGYHRTDNVDVHVPFIGVYSTEEIVKRFWDIYTGGVSNQPWNKLYKKQFITSLFDVEMSIAEDIVFNIGYLKNISKVCLIDEIGYEYSVDNGDSLSKRYNETAFESERKKIVEIRKLLKIYKAEENLCFLNKEFENDFMRCALNMIYASNKKRGELVSEIYEWIMDTVWMKVLLDNRNRTSFDVNRVKRSIDCLVINRLFRKNVVQIIQKVKGK